MLISFVELEFETDWNTEYMYCIVKGQPSFYLN